MEITEVDPGRFYRMVRHDRGEIENGHDYVDAYDSELIPYNGKIPKGPKKIKSWSMK
jgi:hypothetical protein